MFSYRNGDQGGDAEVGRGKKQISERKSALPDADPGAFVVHKWRKKLCTRGELDDDKILALAEKVTARTQRRSSFRSISRGAISTRARSLSL
jgi:hypothetical protein